MAIPFFYLGVLVYLGIVYLPSNGDSLDYHLVRVEHWIQDQSVAPFAAHFTAQIDYPPLAEYNLAHFHLLVGGDRLDGFVQLFAAVVCVVAVSEITRLLGGTRLVQVGAVVISTTIPSVVLSATSTENNLFLASLCACLLYVLIGQPLAPWWRFAGFAGLAAGLAVTTKGTTVLLIGPTAAMLVLWRIVTESGVAVMAKVGRTVVVVGIVGVMVALLAGPSLYQNQKLFGTFDGPDAQAVLSSDLTWRAAGANIVRATAANFMMGNGTSGPETAISKFVLAKLHGVYGAFGVRQGNPNYFEGPESTVFFDAFQVRDYDQWVRSEDEGADPLQVVLMCFAATACLILVVRGDRRMRVLALMASTLTLGYLLLAGIARWQIFEVRFFIPLFVAWTPLVAIALARCSRWLLRITMVVLALACLPQLLDNTERPVRRDSYGANPLAPYLLDSLDRSYIVNTAAGLETLSKVLAQSTCHQLGIGDFVVIEYPVWVGLHDERWRGEIEDVNVQNPSARYEARDFHPCAVLTEPPAGHVSASRRRGPDGLRPTAGALDSPGGHADGPCPGRGVRQSGRPGAGLPGFGLVVPGCAVVAREGIALHLQPSGRNAVPGRRGPAWGTPLRSRGVRATERFSRRGDRPQRTSADRSVSGRDAGDAHESSAGRSGAGRHGHRPRRGDGVRPSGR